MKERSLIQFFPWCSLVVSVGSSVCKGSGLLPSISVIYHPLWGWNNHRHIQSAGPPHSGAWDATQKFMFPQRGLPKLAPSCPLHFFPGCCCLEIGSCISLVQQWKKFLTAKLNLTIWSGGQQALSGFQPQDLSDEGVFYWGCSCCLSRYWERCISRVVPADNHPKRGGKKTCTFLQRLLPSPAEGWRLRSAIGSMPRNNWPLECLQCFGARLSSQKGSCCLYFHRPESGMSKWRFFSSVDL